MKLEEKIKQLGHAFYGRIDREIIDDAISYADFGECNLALETLCDQLYEYAVQLKQEEFEKIRELGAELRIDMERVEFLRDCLKNSSYQ